MQLFSRLSERSVRFVRGALLIGWLLLIASLLLPGLAALWPGPRPPGNRLFWGTVVPVVLLLIGAVSHELWRRICPLAFVSQLARALGRQRSRPGRRGKPEVVMVEAESWLGRHHLALQWSLLIAGLCLRLLAVNGSPTGLAILLLLTLAAALLVGWAWGGKAWCQYVCPMGPVQTVLTGLRGPLGSTAHVGTSAKVTQSMCRTVTADGHEQSACVACQVPCIDIDAERSFWQSLRGERSLGWIWFSYPGLILAFFLLMEQTDVGNALADQPQRVWQSLWPGQPLPRLLEIPLLLSAAAALSAFLFGQFASLLRQLHLRQGVGEASERATQRARLIASFLAINTFFWFVDPLQGALSPGGGQLLRSLVLLATSIGLYRSWGRDQATYRRESASESLRRQLRDLPGLEAALDGRSLDALSPQEVFTLVKAMPALGRRQGRATYREVMAEMLRAGRLSRATALLELQELRQALQLDDSDHHAVVRDLAREQPALLDHDQRQRQRDELRREAAIESIQELLRLSGIDVLVPEALPQAVREELERLQARIGLEGEAWQALLQDFGPRGKMERRRLEDLREDWLKEASLTARLAELAADDPLLRPLHQVMIQRTEGLRPDLNSRLAAAGLDRLPAAAPPAGDLDQALDLLWRDPDPDTAGWVLMLARARDPQRLARQLQDARSGLASSAFLESQRCGQQDPDQAEFPAITAAALFADLLPADILWLARQGRLLELGPGERLMERGGASDSLALVLEGRLQVQTSSGETVELGVGQTVGEMGVIMGRPRSASVDTGPQGARLFLVSADAFEELLRRSSRFGRELLVQLAGRVAPAAV